MKASAVGLAMLSPYPYRLRVGITPLFSPANVRIRVHYYCRIKIRSTILGSLAKTCKKGIPSPRRHANKYLCQASWKQRHGRVGIIPTRRNKPIEDTFKPRIELRELHIPNPAVQLVRVPILQVELVIRLVAVDHEVAKRPYRWRCRARRCLLVARRVSAWPRARRSFPGTVRPWWRSRSLRASC